MQPYDFPKFSVSKGGWALLHRLSLMFASTQIGSYTHAELVLMLVPGTSVKITVLYKLHAGHQNATMMNTTGPFLGRRKRALTVYRLLRWNIILGEMVIINFSLKDVLYQWKNHLSELSLKSLCYPV